VAPARLSAASTGGACAQCWNVYARAGAAGCVGRRDHLTVGDSRGTESEGWKRLARMGPTEVGRRRSCTAAGLPRSAARAGLATSAAPYGGAARDGLVTEQQLTGTNPSHLSATPVRHCVPVWKCSRGNGIQLVVMPPQNSPFVPRGGQGQRDSDQAGALRNLPIRRLRELRGVSIHPGK
jgi:hypothetical protein